MKIAVLPDVHMMERTPKKRKDKLRMTSIRKLSWALEQAKRAYCRFFCVPGDLFDTATASYDFTGEVIKVFRKHRTATFPMRVIGVAGQHDMRYHTRGLKNTPIGLCLAAGVIEIPTIENPILSPGIKTKSERQTRIYGCGWGDEHLLKELVTNEDVSQDILIVHQTIVKDKALFKGQTNYYAAKKYLKRFPFRIILSGDNHARHIAVAPDQVLVNGGSMMRLEKRQIDTVPRLHFVDTGTLNVTYKNIPIEEDIFDEEQLKEDDAKQLRKDRIEELINTIKADTTKVNFPVILNSVTEKSNPNKRQRKLLDDIMDEAREKVGK